MALLGPKATEALKDRNARLMVLGFLLFVVALAVSFFMELTAPKKTVTTDPTKISKDLLIGGDDDELILETISRRTRDLETNIQTVRDTYTKDMEVLQGQIGKMVSTVTDMQREISQIRVERNKIVKELTDTVKRVNILREVRPGAFPAVGEGDVVVQDATHLFPFKDLPDGGPVVPKQTSDSTTRPVFGNTNTETLMTKVVGGSSNTPENSVVGGARDKEIKSRIYEYLAVGIMSGVLLSGIDAPTGNSARQDPFPVLIRVTDPAIMPNLQKLDIRECFVLASGYGDLSSERVLLRTETLSCTRLSKEKDNGKNKTDIIELALHGYITGEDSKAGLRGKVVSRDGSFIARTLLAGLLSGFADAAKPQRLQVLNTNSTGEEATFQAPSISDISQSAAYSGASKASRDLSEYYIDLADEIFPVIEVSGGRHVEIIITQGLALKPKEKI